MCFIVLGIQKPFTKTFHTHLLAPLVFHAMPHVKTKTFSQLQIWWRLRPPHTNTFLRYNSLSLCPPPPPPWWWSVEVAWCMWGWPFPFWSTSFHLLFFRWSTYWLRRNTETTFCEIISTHSLPRWLRGIRIFSRRSNKDVLAGPNRINY